MNSPLKWFGGKSLYADWIHGLAPQDYTHRLIPYAGALGELWNWPCEGVSETVNDANNLLVNFYWVLKWHPESFREAMALTPFSEHEFNTSWQLLQSWKEYPIKVPMLSLAVAYYVVNRMSRAGLGRGYAVPTKRLRRGMNENVAAWLTAVDGLNDCIERLSRVEIRCMDALLFIRKYDHEKALFYCDPPYLPEVRSSTGEYGLHEMTVDDHVLLLKVLSTIKGKFMLSGYHSYLYDNTALDNGWRSSELVVPNRSGRGHETEVVWMNY
jgi:DNA adenine methylase